MFASPKDKPRSPVNGSCGQVIGVCPFWQKITSELRASESPFELLVGQSDIRRATSSYVRYLLKPLHRGRLDLPDPIFVRWEVLPGGLGSKGFHDGAQGILRLPRIHCAPFGK